MAPVPLSVDADPIAERASWIKPPYSSTLGGSAPAVTAVAGPKGLVTTKRRIVLDGTASTSADRKPLVYSWTSLGRSAAITHANTATPVVELNSGPGVYTFELTVTDSQGNSDTDQVSVTYIGLQP